MKKIKNNAPYIIVALITLIIFCIITFVKPKEENNNNNIDTSMFNVVDSKDVLRMINNNETQMIVIGSRTCSATKEFVSSMQISQAKGSYIINYLELKDEDIKSESYKKFLKKLEVPFNGMTEDNKEHTIKEFMGTTPMILIIKNKKVVYGNVGLMLSDPLTQLAYTYGVAK